LNFISTIFLVFSSFTYPGIIILYILKRKNVPLYLNFILVYSFGILVQATFVGFLIFLDFYNFYVRLFVTFDVMVCSMGLLSFIVFKLLSYFSLNFALNQFRRLFNFALIPILIILCSYLFYVWSLYPAMFELPGLDNTRNISNSILLLENRSLFYSDYPLFNFLILFIYITSGCDFFTTQVILQSLTILVPLSFYAMAKVFYSWYYNYKYEPLVSVIFFMTGGGLGWIIVFKEILLHKLPLTFDLLVDSVSKTALDISEAGTISLWLWFRALSMGYVLLFLLISLLLLDLATEDNSLKDALVILILSLGLLFVHLPEFIYWLLVLLSVALFFSERFKEKIFNVILLTTVSFFLGYVFYVISHFNIIPNEILIMYFVFTLVILLVNRTCSLGKMVEIIITKNRIPILITSTILLVYCLGFVDPAKISNAVGEVMGVPLEVWSMVLGIPFFLAVFSLMVKRDCNNDKNRKVYFVFVTILLAIFVGRLITFTNVNIESVYFEQRLVPFTFSLACLLSEITIKYIFVRIRQTRIFLNIKTSKNKVFKLNVNKILLITIIVIIFLGAFISNFLSIVFWYQLIQKGKLSNDEKVMISSLKNTANNSILLAESPRTTWISEYTTSGVNAWLMGNLRNVLIESSNPFFITETLGTLKELNEGNIYLFMSNSELSLLLQERDLSYLGHLLYFYGDLIKNSTSYTLIKVPRPNWIHSNAVAMYFNSDLTFENAMTLVDPYNGSDIDPFDGITIFFRAIIPPKFENKSGYYYLISKTNGHPHDTFIIYVHYQQGYLTHIGFETGNGTAYQSWILPAGYIPNMFDMHDYVITLKNEKSRYTGHWFIDGKLIVSSSKNLTGQIYTSRDPVLMFRDMVPSTKIQIMIVYNYALNNEEVEMLSEGKFYFSHGSIRYLYLSNVIKQNIILDCFLLNKVPFELYGVTNISAFDTIIIPLTSEDMSENLDRILKLSPNVKTLIFLVDNETYSKATSLSEFIDAKSHKLRLIFLTVNNLLNKFFITDKATRADVLSAFALDLFQVLNISKISQVVSINRPMPFYQYNMAFKKGVIEGNGSIIINSGKIIFPNEVAIRIIEPSKKISQRISNVSEIFVVSQDGLTLNVSRAIIYNSNNIFILANLTNVSLEGRALQLFILQTNNSYIQFNNITISIIAPECAISVLKLRLKMYNSVANFYQVTTLGKLASIAVARSWLNESLNVKGNIDMNVDYGGTTLIVEQFSYKGLIERYHGTTLYPKYSYDDSKGFILVVLIFFLYFLVKNVKIEIEYSVGLKAIFASVVMAFVVLVAQQVAYSKFFLPLYVALGGVTYVTTIKVLRTLNNEDFQLIQQVAGEKLTVYAKRFFGFS